MISPKHTLGEFSLILINNPSYFLYTINFISILFCIGIPAFLTLWSLSKEFSLEVFRNQKIPIPEFLYRKTLPLFLTVQLSGYCHMY